MVRFSGTFQGEVELAVWYVSALRFSEKLS